MEIFPNSFIMQKTTDEDILQKRIQNASEDKKDKELMDVCKEFEAVFIHMMLKEMRKTIPDNGLIEKSTATKIFEDMFDEEMAKKMSDSEEDGIGIAKILYDNFKNKNVVKI
ncbi:rod-binding protein [Anaerosalibacter massiliensis]|uniref:rod-binding protein n=1 Tax=Anaerosalibacter massiliensis TaxID=1347392 RepID=UPI0006791596|nr:rod-binding protein [Anaerosalibacter massiliensis]